jgi:hypothetical protein
VEDWARFVVRGLPWTEEQLRKLPPFEFENWAVIAVSGTPNRKQVGECVKIGIRDTWWGSISR